MDATKAVAAWASTRGYPTQHVPTNKASKGTGESEPELESAFGTMGKPTGPKKTWPYYFNGGDHFANQCPSRVGARSETPPAQHKRFAWGVT